MSISTTVICELISSVSGLILLENEISKTIVESCASKIFREYVK